METDLRMQCLKMDNLGCMEFRRNLATEIELAL